MLCFGVFDPPLAPQKTYYCEKAKNMLKFGNFQKSRFLEGPEGAFCFWTLQNDFIYDYLLFFGGWGPKIAIFQKFLHLENVAFKLFGGPDGSPDENLLQKKVPKNKKSLPFEPPKKSF